MIAGTTLVMFGDGKLRRIPSDKKDKVLAAFPDAKIHKRPGLLSSVAALANKDTYSSPERTSEIGGQIARASYDLTANNMPAILATAATLPLGGIGNRLVGPLTRLAVGSGASAGGSALGDVMEGEPIDPNKAASNAKWALALGGLGEAIAAGGNAVVNRLSSSSLRPNKTAQVAAEASAARAASRAAGAPVDAPADYRRLGIQMVREERVRPSQGGARKISARNDADNAAVEDIIAASNNRITASALVRSPQVREVMRDIKMQGAPQDDLAYAAKWLRDFRSNRSTPGTPGTPAQAGFTGAPATPGTRATPHRLTMSKLNTEKRVWRDVSAPVLKAKAAGTGEARQAIEARLHDALSRAAKDRLEAIQGTRMALDPATGKRIPLGVAGLNARIDRRIPLQTAMEDANRVLPQSGIESIRGFLSHHLVGRGVEGRAALAMSHPAFAPITRNAPRLAQAALSDATRRRPSQ